MFRNNLKVALRSLKKDKGFTIINISGLIVGLAACILIIVLVTDELSYDRYNIQADRIVRVNSECKFGGADLSLAITAPPLAAALVNNFPEIESVVRMTPVLGIRCKKGDAEIKEDNVLYSDPGIFGIFTLPMIEGDPATALKEPRSVVISESIAKKYFGRTNVVGQTLFFGNDSSNHKITGVIRDMPRQSHFKADFFLSMVSLQESKSNSWTAINYATYALLRPGTDYKKLQAKLPAFFKEQLNNVKFGVDAFEAGGNYYRIDLIPLTDIHLHSNRARELGVNGNIEYIYIFSAIALLILVMACVNFMNLSTARSSNRARDVGVRKVLGSPRIDLIARFLLESLLLTAIAAILAVFLAWGLLPLFNHLSGKELEITRQTFTWLLPSAVVGIAVIGVAAGAYPAFFLSAFQPIDVLKGKLTRGFKGGGLRSFLVVFQFAISIFLLISTMVVYNQLRYIQNKDLGYNRNQVLIVKNAGALGDARMLKQDNCQVSPMPH